MKNKICNRCGKKTKEIVKETGVCLKCHTQLKMKSGGIYADIRFD